MPGSRWTSSFAAARRALVDVTGVVALVAVLYAVTMWELSHLRF
jgi:hypothetical protein